MSGRLVHSTLLKSSNQPYQIALPGLAKGIYQCTIETDLGQSSQKLVVVN